MSEEEMIDVLDEQGNKTGKVKSRSEIHKDGDWHEVVQLLIINSKGQTLLQRRSFEKKNSPCLWSYAVGGHIDAGERAEDALQRETKEELGLSLNLDGLIYCGNIKISEEFPVLDWKDNEYKKVYLYVWDGSIKDLKLQESEVSEVRWMSLKELEIEIRKKTLKLIFVKSLKSVLDVAKENIAKINLNLTN